MSVKKEYRAVVRVEGAPARVHASPWTTKKAHAEHAAKNHRAMIRDRGWTQVVEIEAREIDTETGEVLL